jgi:hypothetical protein
VSPTHVCLKALHSLRHDRSFPFVGPIIGDGAMGAQLGGCRRTGTRGNCRSCAAATGTAPFRTARWSARSHDCGPPEVRAPIRRACAELLAGLRLETGVALHRRERRVTISSVRIPTLLMANRVCRLAVPSRCQCANQASCASIRSELCHKCDHCGGLGAFSLDALEWQVATHWLAKGGARALGRQCRRRPCGARQAGGEARRRSRLEPAVGSSRGRATAESPMPIAVRGSPIAPPIPISSRGIAGPDPPFRLCRRALEHRATGGTGVPPSLRRLHIREDGPMLAGSLRPNFPGTALGKSCAEGYLARSQFPSSHTEVGEEPSFDTRIPRGKPRGDRPAAHRAPRKGGLWPFRPCPVRDCRRRARPA